LLFVYTQFIKRELVERTSSSVSGRNCKAVAQVIANKAINSRLGGNGPDEKVR
jgi:hypothetical protein